jgi:hypothetical protein
VIAPVRCCCDEARRISPSCRTCCWAWKATGAHEYEKERLDTVDAALSRFDDEPELIELAPHETSLDFFRKIYHSVRQPMTRRMRAAEFALQFEHPKPRAIAIASMNGRDFASLLEKAIERSGKECEVKQIECSAISRKQN